MGKFDLLDVMACADQLEHLVCAVEDGDDAIGCRVRALRQRLGEVAERLQPTERRVRCGECSRVSLRRVS